MQSGRLRYGLGLVAGLLLLAVGCGSSSRFPAVLFLRPDASGAPQLYVQPQDAGSARQLTGVGNPAAPPVIDFAAAPDGERIVYAVFSGAEGPRIPPCAPLIATAAMMSRCSTARRPSVPARSGRPTAGA